MVPHPFERATPAPEPTLPARRRRGAKARSGALGRRPGTRRAPEPERGARTVPEAAPEAATASLPAALVDPTWIPMLEDIASELAF